MTLTLQEQSPIVQSERPTQRSADDATCSLGTLQALCTPMSETGASWLALWKRELVPTHNAVIVYAFVVEPFAGATSAKFNYMHDPSGVQASSASIGSSCSDKVA